MVKLLIFGRTSGFECLKSFLNCIKSPNSLMMSMDNES